jgi:hypothetical protein
VPVVAGHDDGRARQVAVGEGGEDERAQRLRDEGAAAVAAEADRVQISVEVGEEGAQGHGSGHADGRATTRGGVLRSSLEGPSRQDVEAHVLDPVVVERRRHVAHERLAIGLRQPLEMGAEHHRGEVLAKVAGTTRTV